MYAAIFITHKFISLQVNDISVEGAPHSVAVDALQQAGNLVRLVSEINLIPAFLLLCFFLLFGCNWQCAELFSRMNSSRKTNAEF